MAWRVRIDSVVRAALANEMTVAVSFFDDVTPLVTYQDVFAFPLSAAKAAVRQAILDRGKQVRDRVTVLPAYLDLAGTEFALV